ncbi:hypothetical protein DSM112329_03994 [Paraconexibacter sp. AEG42_29]|uniref:Glycoside hydrolase family 42 N-terminal domain-containing protein n=1 Tax=Paraconexibacter sp. AEG42_29 TaxID=2997339 RepID=A0AAU7AZP7_9ACTN
MCALRRTPSLSIAAVLALVGVGTAEAVAAPGLLRVLQDDATLVHGPEPLRTRALDDLPALGVDIVRVNVRWNELAPRRPRDQRDSATYTGSWAPYDQLVREAAVRGVEVLFTVTTPGPAWAADDLTKRFPGARDPDPAAFGRFAEAAGRRYDGSADSPGRVSRWSIVNEPNNPRHLGPQSRAGALHAPGQYRRLVRAGLAGLAATGHRGREVLIGDLLATGRTRRGETTAIGPIPFLRELLCLDRSDRPLRGRALRGHAGCRATMPRLEVAGLAVHLYYLKAGPDLAPRLRGDITPAGLVRLRRTLAAGKRAGRIGSTDVWDTEGGVQTNPPDRVFGVSFAKQAAFLNRSENLLWHTPGVRSFAQYLLRDEPAGGTFQSGLWRTSGVHKPAYAAYRFPLDVRPASRTQLAVWGRVPPRAAAASGAGVGAGTGSRAGTGAGSGTVAGAARTVTLTGPGGTTRTLTVAADRTFRALVPRRAGTYRATAGTDRSRTARAG